jgi:demethylmenaquinone methyltransferase/2-methoxy-6-polyprenyl-1,4-benzoquinol methylase
MAQSPSQSQSNQISIEKYRDKAAGYDASAEFTMPLRRRTVALLQLQPGQTVLDVGAGTGLSYPLLRDGVGPTGRVLAFEQSPEMFEVARLRVQREGWTDVWHINQAAETVVLPQPADAVLFNYTHDICRTPLAVDNLMRQVRPGARVAMAGIKFFPWWAGPLNLLAWLKNRPYNARPADLWQPWSLVAEYCDDFRWSGTQWGMGYIASGTRKADPQRR